MKLIREIKNRDDMKYLRGLKVLSMDFHQSIEVYFASLGTKVRVYDNGWVWFSGEGGIYRDQWCIPKYGVRKMILDKKDNPYLSEYYHPQAECDCWMSKGKNKDWGHADWCKSHNTSNGSEFECDTCLDTGEGMEMVCYGGDPLERRCYCPDCGSGEIIED